MKEEGSRQGAKSAKAEDPGRLGELGAFAALFITLSQVNHDHVHA
jgi:hypothetical protein